MIQKNQGDKSHYVIIALDTVMILLNMFLPPVHTEMMKPIIKMQTFEYKTKVDQFENETI